MKDLDPALIAHLASREQINSQIMVWFSAVQKVGGAAAPWGVWTGEDDRTFVIDGVSRTYYGGGAMGEPGSLTFEAGYVVRVQRVALSHKHPDVAAALAATHIRLRAVDLHQVHLVPGSHDMVAEPLLRFQGEVESLTRPRLAQGAGGMAEVQLASSARAMTRPVDITKSDATLQAVHPGDVFRRYNAISGTVSVAWGEFGGGVAAPVVAPVGAPIGPPSFTGGGR
jgi:hypothetical protein